MLVRDLKIRMPLDPVPDGDMQDDSIALSICDYYKVHASVLSWQESIVFMMMALCIRAFLLRGDSKLHVERAGS